MSGEHRLTIEPIAYMRTDFPTKFGIPRQSGLVKSARGKIVFEPEYRDPNALRGLEDFSHLWIIWGFSEAVRDKWSPTVRPPRLGGNRRMGVFATRAPFRPNPLALTCVEIERVEYESGDGPVIYVRGADLMDCTPIYDIKPYLAYADSIPEATGGFTDSAETHCLEVEIPVEMLNRIKAPLREVLTEVLRQDPRPRYHDDPERIYVLPFADMEVSFRVKGNELTVTDVK